MSSLKPTERSRMPIVFGWSLAGVVDLVAGLFCLAMLFKWGDIAGLVLGSVALLFCLLSFAMALNIHTRQNQSWVLGAAWISWLPLSFGMILRIPLSVVTLLWLQNVEVKESFSPLPWAETRLGVIISRGYARLRRAGSVLMWGGLWSIVCILIVVGILLGYVIPYGQSSHFIVDRSAELVTTKGDNIRFGMTASGTTMAPGLGLSNKVFHCDQLNVHSEDKRHQLELSLALPVKIQVNGQSRDLTEQDIEAFFRKLSGNAHQAQAESLFKTIQQIRLAQESVAPTDPRTLNPNERWQLQNHGLFDASLRLLPPSVYYVEVASLVDSSLFNLHNASHDVYHVSHPSDWVNPGLILLAPLIWMVGMYRIIFGRRRSRQPAALPQS